MSEIDEFSAGWVARALVRHKAMAMIRRSGWPRGDGPDLEQELLVRLVAAMPRYDATRGRPDTFAARVVAKAAASMARESRSQKRGGGRPRPVRLDDPNTPGLADPADPDRTDLALDLADALARLPADLRTLAERLATQSAADAARDAGLPRSTLQRQVTRLRRHFEDAGLGIYHESCVTFQTLCEGNR